MASEGVSNDAWCPVDDRHPVVCWYCRRRYDPAFVRRPWRHDRGVDVQRWYIVVNSPPASGKSTVAPSIAGHFALPLFAKDTVKDALMSVLAVPDVEASRRLGQAAIRTMLALAAASPIGAVLESNFNRLRAVNELRALPGEVLEVFCRCDREVAARRYRTRAGIRHAGHFDQVRTAEELWNDKISEPVAGGWPVLEVDTNAPADLTVIADRIRRAISHGDGRPRYR